MEATIITGQDQVAVANMIRLKYALKLEVVGMKNSHGSAYAFVKKQYNLKGTKQSVFEQFSKIVEKAKITVIA